jgi:hypothetical protein
MRSSGSTSHREVLLEAGRTGPAKPVGDNAQRHAHVKHVVIQAEISDGEDIDVFASRAPRTHAQSLACGQQLVGADRPSPVALKRDFQLAIATDPRQPEHCGSTHCPGPPMSASR